MPFEFLSCVPLIFISVGEVAQFASKLFRTYYCITSTRSAQINLSAIIYFVEGLTYMFYSKIKALQELPQISHHFVQKMWKSIFWTAYGKCTCKSKIILSSIYPLETFRYDTLSLSMTISHLQIAVFLNSHPGSAFGRPVVMAGRWSWGAGGPPRTPGGLG